MKHFLSFSIFKNTTVLFLFVLLSCCANYSFGQCPTWQNQPTCAGPLNAQGGTCGSSFIFCVGDSVGIISNSTGIIDSTFICWNDGTPVQSFAGNFSGCVKHYYNFKADSCVADGQLTLFARLGVQQICSPTNGFNWVIIPIDIRFLPHAAFTLFSDTVCAYEPLVMADQSCANASSFSPANVTWDFGDGTIITGTATSGISIPPHFYSIPGNYTISLSINQGPTGCGVDFFSRNITVLPPTIINPIITLNDLCTPNTFIPDINSNNATGFQWSTNPGGVGILPAATDSQPTFTVNNPGTYIVNLQASGCCYAPAVCTWDTTFTFNQGPSISALGIPSSCNTATINASSIFSVSDPSNIITSYSWSFPGGIPFSSTSATPGNINYTSPGNYPISLIINSTCGNDTIIDTLRIGSPPQLAISLSPLQGCDTITISTTNTSPLGQTYNWTASGAPIISPNNSASSPSFFYNTPGQYQITTTASSPGCAPIQQVFNIDLGKAPELSTITAIPDDCDSSFIFNFGAYFLLNPSVSDSGYLWQVSNSSGAILFSNTTVSPANFQPNAYDTFYVVAMAYNDCDSIVLKDTFELIRPATLVIPNDTTICASSNPIALTVTPSGGIWTFNNTVISATTFDPTSTNQVDNYLVYNYGAANCVVVDSFKVTVIGANVNAGNDQTLCNNSGTITLSGQPSNGVWSGTGISDPTLGIFDPALTTSINNEILYTVTDATTGCITIDTTIVTVFAPTAGSLSIIDTACIGSIVNFDNTISGTTATWDFGDGSSLYFGNNTTHSYSSLNSFVITLIIENTAGCKDTLNDTLVTIQPPTALFSLSPDSGCAPLNVSIQNNSVGSNDTYYIWNYGNGVIDTTTQPTPKIYLQDIGDSTRYTITLTSQNVCGSATQSQTITVYPIPTADFQVDQNEGCSPDTVNFSNVTTGAPKSYQWYINGVLASIDSSLGTQVFIADSTDSIYQVMLIATNHCGSDTTIRNVLVHPNQVVPFFNIDKPYGCRPLTVTFTSSVVSNSVVQWTLGDGNSALGDTIIHIYDTTGTFDIWQYVDNICGYDSILQRVTVFDKPPISFTVPPINCGNEAVQFTNTSIGILGQEWDFGDNSPRINSVTSPQHLYNLPGVYTATLVGYASGTACVDSFSYPVLVTGFPTANLVIADNADCPPFELDLNIINTSQDAVRYQWDFGNGDTLNGIPSAYIYTTPGSYTITLTAIDNNNCSDDTSFSYINVYTEPYPIADFIPNPNTQTILTPVFNFQNTTQYGANYLWNFGDQTISNAYSPNHIYENIGAYLVELIAENNFGCKDSITKEVIVLPDFDMFIPNAFTPNAKNPIFKPYMVDFDPNNFKFTIYNRWGEIVFETQNSEEGWDGRYNGKNAAEGVYVYVIESQSITVKESVEKQKRRGTVTLLR